MRTNTQATTDEQPVDKQSADDLRDNYGVTTAVETPNPDGLAVATPDRMRGMDRLATSDAFIAEVGAPVRLVYDSAFSPNPVEFDGYLAYLSVRRVGSAPEDQRVTRYAVTDRHPGEFATRAEFETSDVVSWRVVDSTGDVSTVREDGTHAKFGTHYRTDLVANPNAETPADADAAPAVVDTFNPGGEA